MKSTISVASGWGAGVAMWVAALALLAAMEDPGPLDRLTEAVPRPIPEAVLGNERYVETGLLAPMPNMAGRHNASGEEPLERRG